MQFKITTIYVDMDGVLVCPYDPISKYLKEDYEEVKSRIRSFSLHNEDNFNSYIIPLLHNISNTDIFSIARPTSGFNTLINTLKVLESKGIEIKILSSVMKNNIHKDNLLLCKQKWLKDKGISWESIFVEGRANKKVYADNNSLLIDDTYINTLDWKQNGGYSIHHTSHENTINFLYDLGLL